MRKLVISLLVIAFMSLMVGQGVVSFLSDTETSAGNTFTAGTIDLQVYGQDHPPALIELPDLKPCQESLDIYIPYQNVGTNPGTVTLTVSYEESDDEEWDTNPSFEFSAGPPEDPWAPEYEVSADDFAKKVYISKAEAHVGGDIVDLMPTLVMYAEHVYPAVGSTIDEQVSLFEFAWQEAPWDGYNIPRVWPLAEVLQPGAGETLVLRFHLDGMAGNEYQADGIVSTLNFEMMQFVPDASMVLDLQMNEGAGTTAYDSTRYHNDGELLNGPAWVDDPPYVGYALDFDGVDDYVDAGNDASLNPEGAITVEGWMYMRSWDDSINDPGWPCLLHNDDTYRAAVASEGMYFGVWDSVGTLFDARGGPPGGMALNTWFHFCGTAERDGRVKLYYDGVEVADVAGPANPFGTATDVLRIGSNPQGRKVDGVIDRVRVYDRALSPEEVFYSYLVSHSHYHGGP